MGRSRHRYRFVIDEAFTPETLPMSRLAEYMANLATLLGEPTSVHFVSVEVGSTALVQDVEHEAHPKVRDRLHAVNRDDGPPDATRAYESLNCLLAADNASVELLEEGPAPDASSARVLLFPGVRQTGELEYGPVTQVSTLQGVVIMVGGKGDPVPVHLEDGDVVHNCVARPPLAKELAHSHYREGPIRATGNGRWFRDANGQWVMRSFQITEYTELADDTLTAVVAELRKVPAKERTDALETLRALRRDEE